ncbi:M14 family metallopeptidase [Stenotrophomonas sp. MMGLT7]|uniref:M14 family metallopeptidase n=1 Tax=Stenotrophomonas sp. MMGLT7 TaxID=2901227 RepID=UPI001E54295E|nr:M14 family metallopeptidase [Stenotrophomonas sp. MMGLT7]MCD7097648.1 M14 family metallopeptidase [Stenotrophomonas sp. MMGLT7]
MWLVALVVPAAARENAALTTVGERSRFVETGRYAEVEALCPAFAQAYPQAVRCTRFGTTPEGRPLLALVASRSGALDAQAARARRLPVLLVQGGIHAGEIEGKDAGLLALRQMLDGEAAPGALDRLVLVFVPVFNVDGHERFARWNRPNQRGPREMGKRATAQNYNLNRDYMKADAPEMRAMLGLVAQWDPILMADLHATDGAQFQHDVAVQIEPLHAGDAQLAQLGRSLSDRLLARLGEQGSLPLPYYPSLLRRDDPASGFAANVYEPRFSTGYFPLRNRFAVLVETHSWKDYATRVRITRNFIVDLASDAAVHGPAWLQAAQAADARAATLGGQPLALDWKASDTSHPVDFLGYAYKRTPSPVSGALATRYDESRPQVWRVPLYDEVVPAVSATAPRAGYLVPAAQAVRIAPLLDLHGIAYQPVATAQAQRPVQVFRATRVELAAASFEGRQRAEVDGQWQDERQDVAAGSLFVPIAQPRARLLVALLEPQAPDSLLAWGEFNTMFEPKEYMEAYVAEEVAIQQLRDPAVAAEFAKKLGEDADFARDPRARLAFFARRHASWDPSLNLYPVYRLDEPLSRVPAR